MRQKTKRQSLWRWSWLACAVQVAWAHAAVEDEFLDMSLEELVDYRLMSMSRKEQRVADMAAAAYVISAEEIRRSGAQSIPEALRLVPGLNVAQINHNSWAVSSRGFNERFSGKLLVQVDGRSVYSPLFSGVLWETQDAIMEDIERIEVIRGPGAALWGTNAMNGVINIVTRSAASTQGNLFAATVGTGELASTSLRHAGVLAQGGHYKVYGKASSMGGALERNTGGVSPDGSSQQRVGVKLEPQVEGGQLSIKADLYQHRSKEGWAMPSLGAGGNAGGFSDSGTPYSRDTLMAAHDQGGALQARYAWKSAEGAENILQASIDHDSAINTGVWGSGAGASKPLGVAPSRMSMGGEKTDIDVDFQQRKLYAAHDFIWGLNFRHTRDDLILPASPYYLSHGKDQRVSYSAFVHDEIALVPERLKLILGSKFEKDGLTGFNVQPNARVLYTPSQSEAYWGALSRSVRSPRRTESMSTIDISAVDAASLNALTGLNLPANMLTALTQVSPQGNAAVQAEKAISLEAGWRKQFSNFLSIDSSLFLTDYSDLRGGRMAANPLSPLEVQQAMACLYQFGPGACYFTLSGYNTNLDKARSWGGEVSLEWHPYSWWKMQAAYSHLRIKGAYTGDMLGDYQKTGQENGSPRHQISLNNNFTLAHGLNLDVRWRYQSQTAFFTVNASQPVRIAPYTGLDMRLAWQVHRHTELSILGRNLLKARHTEFMNTLPTMRAYDVQRSALVQAVVRF
ncbi:MAG: TonB-dependent receptor plug domain-containing protein [Limnohabitans sp.]